MPAAERRGTIVAAATPLVRQYGRAVTTSQIAAAAHVSEGTLFHVFEDKDAIIDAVIEVELSTDAVVAELRALDRSVELRVLVVSIVEVLRRRLGSIFELMTAVGMRRPPFPPGDPRHRAAHAALLTAVSEALGAREGQLRYPVEEAATLVRLLTFAATHPAISDGRPMSSEQIADVLLYGVAGPEARRGAEERSC